MMCTFMNLLEYCAGSSRQCNQVKKREREKERRGDACKMKKKREN